jgi:hypothetical protein
MRSFAEATLQYTRIGHALPTLTNIPVMNLASQLGLHASEILLWVAESGIWVEADRTLGFMVNAQQAVTVGRTQRNGEGSTHS